MPYLRTGSGNGSGGEFQDGMGGFMIGQGFTRRYILKLSHNLQGLIEIKHINGEAHEEGVHAFTGSNQHALTWRQGFIGQQTAKAFPEGIGLYGMPAQGLICIQVPQ